jgi:hypothetical protein
MNFLFGLLNLRQPIVCPAIPDNFDTGVEVSLESAFSFPDATKFFSSFTGSLTGSFVWSKKPPPFHQQLFRTFFLYNWLSLLEVYFEASTLVATIGTELN